VGRERRGGFCVAPAAGRRAAVDILVNPPLDIDAAFQRVEYRSMQGLRLPVISVRDLIALKEHAGREQDLADIEHLRRLAENFGP